MVIKTASPGVIVNEVDLTRGTSDGITSNVGGFVGPFARGPVDELVLIETESELQKVFGDPTTQNAEYWYTVANFLDYGGICYVVRCDDASGGDQLMKNSVSNGSAVYIKNNDAFVEDFDNGVSLSSTFAARTPGAFGNALGIAVIDAGADQTTKVGTTLIKDANGVAQATTTRPQTAVVSGTIVSTYQVVKVGSFVIPDPGFLAVATATGANIDLTGEQTINGVTTSASRILVGGQTNESDNGIYVTAADEWVRAEDADASGDFEYGKPVLVSGGTLSGTWYYTGIDSPTIGSTNITFNTSDPTGGTINLFDFVQLGNADGGGAASGFISEINTTAGNYVINVTSGTFVGAIGTNSHLADADGNEISGVIVAAEAHSASELYEPVDVATNTTMNVINVPNAYTVTAGNTEYGWTLNPRPGLTATSTAGAIYVYDASTQMWKAFNSLKIGSVLGDGTNYFQLVAAEDWYAQQIAFEGIPWYRFASRPTTSFNAIERGASNDAMNIIVYDATGDETGSKGNMLESYFGVSKLKGALTPDGEANYYHKVLNERSGYVYSGAVIPEIADGTLNAGHSAVGTTIGSGVQADYVEAKTYGLDGGVDQLDVTLGERQIAYNKFTTENVSILDYILQGPGGANLMEATGIGNFLINVVEERKDCMCFLSPYRSIVVGQNDSETITKSVEEWADTLTSSSYAVFDSGYKYMYDRFNDVYIYVPLNGDIAGTVVYTAVEAEPYYSPAGMARGQVRNVIKLSYNPAKAQRDILYAARVNPVVTFPGEGTVLFGDKTGLSYSSAFDRINVRRLFLVIEREVAEISRQNLFEFNDEVTRTLFKNNVNPYLRDIQSKRGMDDFLVVCDETNNTPGIIDRNEFIADVYIKPARSINFVTLNFVATKTGVAFDEAVALFRGTLGATN